MRNFDPEQVQRIDRALQSIRSAVRDFGSAIDADNHYSGAGAPLEAAGNAAIRDAFAYAPELAGLLPELHAQVLRGDDLADRGYAILDELKSAKRALARRRAKP